MSKLNINAFSRAKSYIQQNGRPLEKSWFKLIFESGDHGRFTEELKKYQHSNGGFGNKLEPDHQTLLPSAYTSCFAFQFFPYLETLSAHKIIDKTVSFLKSTYNAELTRWLAFPREANKDPHAIWWHYKENEVFCDVDKMWGLPSAEILGFLLKYDPDSQWEQLFAIAVDRIDEVYPDMDMNEASSFIKMYSWLDISKKAIIKNKLLGIMENLIEYDESKWTGYCAVPLHFIHSPESEFYSHFKDITDKNIDWEIQNQNPEGYWEPGWQWYRDDDNWPAAKEQWKSFLTVDKLIIFKNFDRIE